MKDTTNVIYKADIEREMQNRAAGKDFDDYNLVDELRKELKLTLGVETACFQDLRYKTITVDFETDSGRKIDENH